MKISALLVLVVLLGLRIASAQESDTEVQARKVALELAGAFANDEFMLRDGHWSGQIEPGQETLVAVNLYAGNQYWFSVGASEAARLAVRVYDENGKPVTSESYEGADHAAAGFSPSISGQYFVGIAPQAASPHAYCLVYSYK